MWQNITNMGANSSYTAMHNIVEQAKEGTILMPDDFRFIREMRSFYHVKKVF